MNTSFVQQPNRPGVALPPPPLAKGLPILGNALGLAGDTGGFLRQKYQELGPVFRVRALNEEFVVLAGQEANLFVTKEGTKYLSSAEAYRPMNIEYGAERSLLSLDGADHNKLRNLVKRWYSPNILEHRLNEAVAITKQEVATWSTTKPQPVFYLIQRIIMEQLGVLITNCSAQEYLDDLIKFSRTLIAAKILKKRPGFMTSLSPYRRARARVLELGHNVIASHTQQPRGNREPDLIDDLLEIFQEDPQLLPTEGDKVLAVLNPFVVGLETAASTAAFMLYALLKHPDILEQATIEAKALFANGIPTLDSLHSLDVLHRTTLEVLRMYPTAVALFRTVAAPFEFAGYRIEAGQKALIGTTVPHLLPEFYPNPLKFDIDRYSKPREEHRKPGVFNPFGVGSHLCVGMNLGQALIILNIATILQAVRLEMVPGNYQLHIDPIPTPSPDAKFQIRVIERFS
ncbi:MAG: cytochrome P450 [Nostoc sp.]|uniref:cytochrome P450 n=1 Tax=Nostoc sp. TaxID=1180 RepID=UPI002FFCB3AB